MRLSIIIPVFNEEKTLEEIVERISELKIAHEIIIVDDGSGDNTKLILEKIKHKQPDLIKVLINEINLGKGSSIRRAINEVKGDYMIVQDADLEYEPEDILRLMEASKKYDKSVIFGSRFLNNKMFCFHYIVNYILTTLTNVLFNANLTDMETCYKLCKIDLVKSLDLYSRRFEIEPEIVAKLLKRKINIAEVPISYKRRTYNSGKKITWLDGIKAVLTLFKHKLTV